MIEKAGCRRPFSVLPGSGTKKRLPEKGGKLWKPVSKGGDWRLCLYYTQRTSDCQGKLKIFEVFEIFEIYCSSKAQDRVLKKGGKFPIMMG
ncbi:hypothetical protein [Spirochaeta thermophila]|uniref:hypothetical protein n=1 Tax=Winmispira thermophila TaxID=154 RepID=UPI0012DF257D|nr:hypothetical protein [Spirochaeta thermophila]